MLARSGAIDGWLTATSNFVWILLVLLGSARALPLQWERLLPSGFSPDPRYDAAGCLLSDLETSPILYGGISFDTSGRLPPGTLDGCFGTPCSGEVHTFDIISQGWDKIQISAISSQDYPAARGGHSMTSVGRDALVCGGYQPINVASLTVYERERGIFEKRTIASESGLIDCWWLRILPDASWERLVVTNESFAPPTRSHHAAVYDFTASNVILFGGESSDKKLLNDCWYLSYATNVNGSRLGTWSSCDLVMKGPQPAPRRGHSLVLSADSGVLFVFGGFALSTVPGGRDEEAAVNDIWALRGYSSTSREWQEMTPLSAKPAKRAFHAAWMIGGRDGFKMVVHGGQSDEGVGENSVVHDTWRLDLTTNVWTKYSSDPEAPPVFQAFASSVSNSSAMLFGGRTDANKLFGRVMVFDTTQGWVSVLPAGRRPEKRSGHVVAYDDDSKWMMVSHGMNWKGNLLEDTWTLNVETGAWSRVSYGRNSVRPPKGTLSAFVSTDTTLFSVGGISDGGALQGHSEVWSMLTSILLWKPVKMMNQTGSHTYPTSGSTAGGVSVWDAAVKPPGRTQSAAVKLDAFGGLLQPILLLGGKGGHAVDGGPLNDIWVFDSVPLDQVPSNAGANPAVQDSMASFDGEEDYIAVPLPSFAGESRAMSAVWIEAWLRVDARVTQEETLLFDLIYVDNVVLRLVMMSTSATDTRPVLRLYFFPGSSKQLVVKTWGPIALSDWSPGSWHHAALTLRFAPIASGQLEPDLVPAQAFLFIDSYRVPDDERFMLLDLKELRIGHGLTKITFGGTSQSSLSDTFGFFKGDMDSIRVWWIDCPPGPTACNPYGFLYPQQDYSPYKRLPAAGILDNAVRLKDVAPQILESMFTENLAPDTPGLLISLDFNQVENGQVVDSSTWLPDECTTCGEKVCPGCQAQCVFDQCKNFDVDCIEDDGMSNLEFLSESGSCECLDSETCPKNVENCQCPRGFVRECEDQSSSKNKNTAKAGAEDCKSWFCACKDQLRPTCTRCILNGQRTTPSDPCNAPSICTSRLCLFPFLSRFDKDTPDGGVPTLNPSEFLSWVNITLQNYMPADPFSGQGQGRYFASAFEWFREQFQYTPFGSEVAFYFDDNLHYDRKLAWALFCHADEDGDGLLTAGEVMKNIFGDSNANGFVSLSELGTQYRALWSLNFQFSPDENITKVSGYVPSTYCPGTVDCSVFSGGDVECEGGFPTHLIDSVLEDYYTEYAPGSSSWCDPALQGFCPELDFIGSHPLEAPNHPNFYPDPYQLLLPSALFISALNMTSYGTVSYQSAQSLFEIDAVTWIFEDQRNSEAATAEDIDCKLLWSLERIRCDRGASSSLAVGVDGDYEYNYYGDYGATYNDGFYGGFGDGGGNYGGYGNGNYGAYGYTFDPFGDQTGGDGADFNNNNYYENNDGNNEQDYVYLPPNYYCPEEEFLTRGGVIEFLNPGGYVDYSECFWLAQRQDDLVSIYISFQVLLTEGCCDFVTIKTCAEGRTGFSCNEIDSFSGETTPDGRFHYPLPENGYLQVRFKADVSQTQLGFVLDYQMSTDVPEAAAVSACPTELSLGPLHTITYLESGGYKDNDDCSWVLPSGFSSLTIDFTDISTESCCDSVVIESCREGLVGISCSELARFGGFDIPGTQTYTVAEDAFVFIRFISDGSQTYRGFELSYVLGFASSDGPGGGSQECPAGQFLEYAGQPSTVEFMPSGGYSNNQECSWLVPGGDGFECFAVTFQTLSTESCCDFVEFSVCEFGICTGYGAASGTSSPTLYFSVPIGAWLEIKFVSDVSVTESGFILQYEASDQCSADYCTLYPCDCDPCLEFCNPQIYFCGDNHPTYSTFSSGGGPPTSLPPTGPTSVFPPPTGPTSSFPPTGPTSTLPTGPTSSFPPGGTSFSTGGMIRRRLMTADAPPLHPAQEAERQAWEAAEWEEGPRGRVLRQGRVDGGRRWASQRKQHLLTIGAFVSGRDPASKARERRRAVRRIREKRRKERELRAAPVVAPGKGARARGRALQGRPLRGTHSSLVEAPATPRAQSPRRPAAPRSRQHPAHTGGPTRALKQFSFPPFQFSFPTDFGGGCFDFYGYQIACSSSPGFGNSMPGPGISPSSMPMPGPPTTIDFSYDYTYQCFEASATCLGRSLNNGQPEFGAEQLQLGDCPCNLAGGCVERAHSGAVISSSTSRDAIFALFRPSDTATAITQTQLDDKVSEWGLGQGITSSFSTIDTSGNGEIDAEELYEYLLQGAHGETDWFLALFDRDCNGRIGFEEASLFCSAYEFDLSNYHNFYFEEYDTALVQLAWFYNRVEYVLPLCPFKIDAAWQEPRLHLTREGLESYLWAMKFVRVKDTNGDGWLFFGDASEGTVEWTVSSSRKAASAWLARLGGKSDVVLAKAGPELIFELINGSPDSDGQGSDEINIPDIQGWPDLVIEVYDVNSDAKLEQGEAMNVMWYMDAYFEYLDTLNATKTDQALEASEIAPSEDDISQINQDRSLALTHVDWMANHTKVFLFLTESFLDADRNRDDKISPDEWAAAGWDADPTAPSFTTVDANGDGFVTDIEALMEVGESESFGAYQRCPFFPCQDCSTWDAGFGGCETYREGELNHEFCTSDYDIFTIYAIDACPRACLTGNVTYICGVNTENATLATEETLTATGTGASFSVLAARTVIPPRALPQGIALASFRTKYENPNSASVGEKSLKYWWNVDSSWTESSVGLDAPSLPRLNAGVSDAVLNLDLKREEGRNVFSSAVTVTMGVDPCVVRQASGCVLVNNNVLRLCAPGQAHLHHFNESTQAWDKVRGPRTAVEIPIPELELPSWCADAVSLEDLQQAAGNQTTTAAPMVATTPSPSGTAPSPVTVMRQVGCSCADFFNASCTGSAQPTVSVDTTKAADWWMVIGQPHCCIYNGTGKPCSSKVCRTTANPNDVASPAYLGEGAPTKKPSVVRSTRPKFTGATFEENLAQFEQELTEIRTEDYVPRTGWLQVCITGLYHSSVCPVSDVKPKQAGANWFQKRFGHAATAISGSRVIIHGGFGCNPKDCPTVTPLFDTWELYINALGSDTQEMFQLHELSPVAPGLGGLVALPLSGQDHRLFVIGGASESMTLAVLGKTARPSSLLSMSYRELLPRDKQIQRFLSSVYPAASGHTAVGNDTTALVFGGFVSNSMTSGVFTLDLTAATFDSAFKRMQIIGTSPEARAYAPMFMAGSESMIMIGGISSQVNDDGLGVTRTALKDVWQYSFVNSRWTQLDTRWKGTVSRHAFGASTSYSVEGSTLMLMHGGVSDAYVPGVTSTLRWLNRAPQPWSYGPGPRQASTEFKALLPSEWLAGSSKSRWIRVRPYTSDIKCMSVAPVCQEERTDDYWGCYAAPYPWWAKIANDFTLSPCQWTKADESCEQLASDGGSAGCYRPLPDAMTCEPPARYMHTIASGAFLGGRDAVVMTGGMDMYGRLLSDTWMYDLSTFPTNGNCQGCGFLVKVQLFVKLNLLACKTTYLTALRKLFAQLFGIPRADRSRIYMEVIEAPEAVLNPSSQLCAYQCASETDTWNLITKQARNKDVGERVTLVLSIPYPRGYHTFLSETCPAAGGCKEAYQLEAQQSDSDDLKTSTLSSIFTMENLQTPQTLEACYESVNGNYAQFWERCLTHREARVDIRELDSSLTCTEHCARGICQFEDITRYADGVVGCASAGPCAGDGTCSVPGPRYGHAATSFKYRGGASTLVIFGGEAETATGETELKNDVIIGSFQATSMTYARLKVGCSEASPCPRPRRDASIAIIDNRGGSSGKLLVFAGLAGSGQSFFDNDMEEVDTLDDLWVLDLDQIHADGRGEQCLYYARCSVTMRWSELEVPGARPTSRFGASMAALDQFAEGILYLADGQQKLIETNAVVQTTEIDDLFVFQLHDPFYKHCAATGKGLTQAIAGRTTTFNLACTDILGNPANGAQFSVTIKPGATCTGCPSVFPPVTGVGEGLYACNYVPIEAGEYVLTVKVGRGGPDFQELVGGDPTEMMSNVKADIERQRRGNNGLTEFSLFVSAAQTSRRTSMAQGDAVTLSTAGAASTFTINSVDAFLNLRPGGDDMSVVFRPSSSLNAVAQLPTAGKVLDNNDGSYLVQYAITRAGGYTVSITVNGVLGVGSPFTLQVEAELPDEALTYAYGAFFGAKTGKTFTVYVQTRDRYGNFISTDPALFPNGATNNVVSFEYCNNVNRGGTCPANDAQCTCQGGSRNPNVQILIDYGVGPNGATRPASDGGGPYYGLYRINWTPYNEGSSTPLVRHNGVYVKCYHSEDTYAPLLEVPLAAADLCVRNNVIQELTAVALTRSTLEGFGEGSRILSHPLTWGSPAYPQPLNFPPTSSDRRSLEAETARRSTADDSLDFTSLNTDNDDRFKVLATFSPPDTAEARTLAQVVPSICFLVGTGIAFLQFFVDWYRNHKKNKLTRIHDEYIAGLEAKGISLRQSIEMQAPEEQEAARQDIAGPEGREPIADASAREGGDGEGAAAGIGLPADPAAVPIVGVEADPTAAPGDNETPAGGPSTLNSPDGPGGNVMAAGQDMGRQEASLDSEIQPVKEPTPRMEDLRDTVSQDSVSQLIAEAQT